MAEYIIRVDEEGYEKPTAIMELVRCKYCKHRPTGENRDDLEFPDEICPCQCEDFWYNWKPADEWYCGSGERKDGGGDCECDHIHCHKWSSDINIGNMVNREAVAWMIRDTCIELAKTADKHYDEHIDDYIIDDQAAVRWLTKFNALAQKRLKELPPAERVGYWLRCIDCAHYNDGF